MAEAAPVRRAALDFAWLLGGRLAMAVLALAALRQATALLPTAEFGRLALFIAIQGFAALLIIGPIGQHVTVNFHRWQTEGTLWGRAPGFLGWIALSGLAGALAGLAIGERTVSALLVLAGNIAAINLYSQLSYFLNLAGQRRLAVTWGLIGVALGLAAALLLVAHRPTALAWFAGQGLGWLLAASGAAIALRRVTGGGAGGRRVLIDRATFIAFCLPLAAGALALWLLANGHRFLIERLWDLETLGLVAAGLVPAVQLWALAEMLANQLLQPACFRRLAAGEPSADVVSDMLNVLGPLHLVLLAAAVAAAPALLLLFVDARYADAGRYLVAGVLLEGARVLAGVFGLAAQATRRTAALPWPPAIGAVVTLGGLMLLAGQPIAVAIWVLPLGGAVALLLMAWRMRVQLAFRLDRSRWFGAGGLLGMAAVVALLPLPVTGPAQALGIAAAVGLVALAALGLLLARSAALRRLL